MQPIVVFDESGNTGQNLLDPMQPVFALASVYLTAEETEQLVRPLKTHAREVHFVRLKRTTGGQKCILELLNSPLITPERIKLVVYHKSFMITAKMVDILVETFLHDNLSIDMHVNGFNLALANLWHSVMPTMLGFSQFTRLQRLFVQMVREPSESSIAQFFTFVNHLRNAQQYPPLKADLGLLHSTRSIVEDALPNIGPAILDPAVPVFIQLAVAWNRSLGQEFQIVHDASKPLKHAQTIIEYLMAKDEPKVEIGYDDRTMQLPLNIAHLTFQDSQIFPQIQVADVLAGAATHWAGSIAKDTNDKFADEIEKSGLEIVVVDSIWPSDRITPEDLGRGVKGGTNPIDYVSALIARQGAKNRKA